ncbi:Vitamin K epoxide reductase family protein [Amycolatopsis arida]|uniref:Vitamin K epoxide reductase family protein n=1 Tax=Amycolatopsis arida TaxID=587909 RepID=A0A1I5ZBG1_9PSEU|nr:vitamin K epoxide reductase family protein [Amycolatopsis arida]TDX89493.1 vitamin K epoxide reductase family protein [Amycolatopsis arida]SFQ53839.1 Vitamin K epoxide reductase family protein [Amycolatopsis arida]
MRIGRRSTPEAARLSMRFRAGGGPALARQRATVVSALVASAALSTVGCYQLGLIRHLPDPPLPMFDSDTVDASGEAYVVGRTPDGIAAAASAMATAALAVWGGPGVRRPKLLRVLTAIKATGDATGAVLLFVEQLQTHRKLCSWCTLASLAHLVTVPLTLPEALRD